MKNQSIGTKFLLMIYKNNKWTKYLLVSKLKLKYSALVLWINGSYDGKQKQSYMRMNMRPDSQSQEREKEIEFQSDSWISGKEEIIAAGVVKRGFLSLFLFWWKVGFTFILFGSGSVRIHRWISGVSGVRTPGPCI